MNSNEKQAKLIALAVLYSKDEESRNEQVQRISCRPREVKQLLSEISDEEFRQWVQSVAHLFKS